ncbi:Wd40 Repeat-Containing Protein Smu1 [Manis pentadactyla]|nr:Wd40 Repeat-Containing Protein Smu1 [Manis pentadactyla]
MAPSCTRAEGLQGQTKIRCDPCKRADLPTKARRKEVTQEAVQVPEQQVHTLTLELCPFQDTRPSEPRKTERSQSCFLNTHAGLDKYLPKVSSCHWQNILATAANWICLPPRSLLTMAMQMIIDPSSENIHPVKPSHMALKSSNCINEQHVRVSAVLHFKYHLIASLCNPLRSGLAAQPLASVRTEAGIGAQPVPLSSHTLNHCTQKFHFCGGLAKENKPKNRALKWTRESHTAS